MKIDFVFALTISLIFSYIFISKTIKCEIQNIIPVICTISVTLLGFLITAYALLLAFPKGGNMNLISQHPAYPSIFDCFMLTIYVDALLLAISTFGLFTEIYLESEVCEIYYCLLIFFTCYSLITLMRCLYLLYNLTKTLFNTD